MENILIIDDSEVISSLLASIILPAHGYAARVAHDGASGIVMLRQQRPDLILLDLELPDTTGLQMLQRIAELDATIPVILMTAHGSELVAVEAFRLGAKNYLIKPFNEADAAIALERALRESRLQHDKHQLTLRLQQRVREVTTLGAVGRSLTSLLDIEQLLERIVEAGVFLTHAEAGLLLLLDDAHNELYLRAAKNIGEERVKRFRVPVTDSLAGHVIQTAKPLLQSKSRKAGGLKIKTGFLAQSLLYVPIMHHGHPIGVLGVTSSQHLRSFTEHDQWLMTSLADYGSIALENARLFQTASREQARYHELFNDANDIIFTLDEHCNLISLNRRGQYLTGYSPEEIKGRPLRLLSDFEHWKSTAAELKAFRLHHNDSASFDFALRDKDGKLRYTEVNARMISRDIGSREIVCIARDVTERKQFEDRLHRLAFHDPLTSLPNRALLLERLNHALSRTQRSGAPHAVLFLDLDNFKLINDSLGHEAGDAVLQKMGKCLQRCVRPADTVARFGGDEFIILLEDLEDVQQPSLIAQRVLQELQQPITVDGQDIFTMASVGLATSSSGITASELVRNADTAMYYAKAQGKNRYAVFTDEMNERAIERLKLETDLRRAVERNEFDVFYQPIVDLKTGVVSEVEALVRWNHPERGQIAPANFVPIAEETGLIIPIGQLVLEQACRQVRAWHDEFPTEVPLILDVNLSPRQFQQPQLVPMVAETLRRTRFNPQFLKLEITEGMLMQDGERTAVTIRELKNLGLQLAIDDFGTGYCSLSYLKRFPVDTLKIDRSFIAGLGSNPQDTAIVQAIIAFAQALGISITGEGIETEAQIQQLDALACTRGQGYYLSRPLTRAAFEKILAQRQPLVEQQMT